MRWLTPAPNQSRKKGHGEEHPEKQATLIKAIYLETQSKRVFNFRALGNLGKGKKILKVTLKMHLRWSCFSSQR